jgi:HKD family nuclease
MDKIIQIFNSSLQTGYVDKNVLSDAAYQSELLVNQKIHHKSTYNNTFKNLKNCKSFFISVAFVTTSGVAIINKLKELEKPQIRSNFSFTIFEFQPNLKH